MKGQKLPAERLELGIEDAVRAQSVARAVDRAPWSAQGAAMTTTLLKNRLSRRSSRERRTDSRFPSTGDWGLAGAASPASKKDNSLASQAILFYICSVTISEGEKVGCPLPCSPFSAPLRSRSGVVARLGPRRGVSAVGTMAEASWRRSAEKWRREGLKQLIPRSEMAWNPSPRSPSIFACCVLQIFEPNLMKRLRRSPKLHVARRAPPEPPQKALRSW